MMATKILLAWNNDTQQYWAELEQGTLYVDGDAFAEERSDRVRTIIARAHPELDIDTISELISESVQGDEVDRADDNVFAELEDPTTWLSMAVDRTSWIPANLMRTLGLCSRRAKHAP